MKITRLDHLVLTVRDIPRTVAFYTTILGMSEVLFAGGRTALSFGNQKINLHQSGHEFDPKAANPTPGSADLCLISETPIETVVAELKSHAIEIVEGPVFRTGAAVRSSPSIYEIQTKISSRFQTTRSRN